MPNDKEEAAGPSNGRKLTLAQSVQCCNWLNENWEKIEEQRPTRYHLRGQMREALHIHVADSGLTRMLEAVGKKLPTALKERKTSKDRDRIRRLSRIVLQLFVKLGEQPPPDLLHLAGALRRLPGKAPGEVPKKPMPAFKPAPPAPAPVATPTPAPALAPVRVPGPPQMPSNKEIKRAQQALARAADALRKDRRISNPTSIDLLERVDQRWLTALRRADLLDVEIAKVGFAVEAVYRAALDELVKG